MYSIEELLEQILLTVDEEIKNKKLINALKEEFIKKKLNPVVPALLFQNNFDEENLSIIELIGITKILYKFTKKEELKLSNYFSQAELFDYENLIIEPKQKKDSILIKEVRMIDPFNYHCILTAEQLSEMRENRQIAYFKSFQRASKLVNLRNGKQVRKINVNKKGVRELENRFTKKNIKPTSIALTVLLTDEGNLNEENFVFEKKYCNTGDLFIKPNFTVEDKDYLPLIISDGMHRYTAICNAYEAALEKGEHLDVEIGCYIHIMTTEQARQYVLDVFQRNDTDIARLKNYENTDENKYVRNFEQECRLLNGKVAGSKKELKSDMYITFQALIDTFNSNGVHMMNSVQATIQRQKIARILNDILAYLYYSKKNYSKDLFKEKFIIQFLTLSIKLKDTKGYEDSIVKIITKMIDNIEYLKSLKKYELDEVFKKEYIDKIIK